MPRSDTAPAMTAVIGLSVLQVMAALDQTVVTTALPRISGDLGSVDRITRVVSAYLVAATACTPILGRLCDTAGRKPVLCLSLAAFLLGSLACGIAGNLELLASSRLLQGAGGGGLIACGQVIMADLVEPAERPRYQGYLGAGFGVGSALGPAVGGLLTDTAGWRWIFLLNIPVGLVAAALLLRQPLSGRDGQRGVDPLAAGLLVLWASSFVLAATSFGESRGTGWTLVWLAAGTLGLLAFLVRERGRAVPVLPLSLLRRRRYAAVCVTSFALGGPLVGGLVFLSVFLQVVRGRTPMSSAIDLTPLMLGLVLASFASGRVVSRGRSPHAVGTAGCVLVAGSLLAMTRLDSASSEWLVLPVLTLLGLGVGSVIQLLLVMAQAVTPRASLGSSSSTVIFLRSLGGAFGVALFGAIFARALRTAAAAPPGGTSHDSIARDVLAGSAPAALRHAITRPVTGAVHEVFLLGALFAVVAAVSLGLFSRPASNPQHDDTAAGRGLRPADRPELTG
jgi:EmrB/QacA subfamily drug resistance transporter